MNRPSKPYHHGALPAALVDAAVRLTSSAGADGVSLREVARRAGVSQAAPYHYFADKQALLAAVAAEGFRLLDQTQVEALAGAGDDPAARLAALAIDHLGFALDHPHLFRLMHRRPSRARPEPPAAAQILERQIDAVRAARLAAGHDDLDPAAVAAMIWSVPHGLALQYLDGPLGAATAPRALEDLVRAAVGRLVTAPLDEAAGERSWAV